MSEIIKISEAANMGIHAMMYLSSNPDRLVPQREIAESLKVSEAHLAKVFQRLGKAGLVKATRGPSGGYRLSEKPEDITVLQIYEALDGPLKPKNCLFDKPVCKSECCGIGQVLGRMNKEIRDYLHSFNLSQAKEYFLSTGV